MESRTAAFFHTQDHDEGITVHQQQNRRSVIGIGIGIGMGIGIGIGMGNLGAMEGRGMEKVGYSPELSSKHKLKTRPSLYINCRIGAHL